MSRILPVVVVAVLLLLTSACEGDRVTEDTSLKSSSSSASSSSWELCRTLLDQRNLTFVPADLRPIVEGTTVTIRVILALGIAGKAGINVATSDERVTRIQRLAVQTNGSGISFQPLFNPDHPSSVSSSSFHLTDIDVWNSSDDSANVTYRAIVNDSDCDGIVLLSDGLTTVLDVDVLALRLGKSQLSIFLYSNDSDVTHNLERWIPTDRDPSDEHRILEFPQTYPVVVLRRVGLLDTVFHITIQVLLAVINFTFGCKLDTGVVMAYLKRPLAPCLGFCSQYIFMPLLGLTITLILGMDPAFSIGLIALACSPGGGASNAWTILLGGDINLSLTMTFLSLTLALGMMPLWMFIVTRVYFRSEMVDVPYFRIFTTLCYFVGPCFVGIAVKRFKPTWAAVMVRLAKPLSILFLAWVLLFGTYVNLYMWRIMGEVPLTIVAGILLPWCGFLFGLGLAFVARQGRHRAIAISIETGIQNIGVPIVLLQRSFAQPDGDLAATVASAVGIFTPLPLFVALITLTLRRRYCAPTSEGAEKSEVNVVNADNNSLVASSGTIAVAVDCGPMTTTESSEMFIKLTDENEEEL